MKTNKIRLLATMITLATVTIATAIPATAQRRQSQNNRTETRVQRSNDRQNRSNTQNVTRKTEKSASKSSINRSSSQRSEVSSRGTRNVTSRTQQPKVVRENRASSNKSAARPMNNVQKRQDVGRTSPQRTERKATTTRQAERSRNTSATINSGRTGRDISAREKSARHNSGVNQNNRANYERRSTGINSRNTREMYRLDENDKRYSPNTNYRGSKQVWNNNHPRYGHVIRKFVYRPNIFVHNNSRYYCYDGHFFRYFRGVGYVLVDVPFGIVFDAVPHGYERVYINGYLYLRVGNLFFEYTDFGFRLVHYPERYYAYDDGYRNEGYYFEDDLYY
jgi:hypothetical protein